MAKHQFKKGNNYGRPKNSENKVNKEARQLFMEIMERQIPKVEESLDKLSVNPKAYLECLSKLMPYFLTKKIDVSSGDQPITQLLVTREVITKKDDQAS